MARRFVILIGVVAVGMLALGASTALAKPGKFYDSTLNGYNGCSGAGGTDGGAFGAARVSDVGAEIGTVNIRVRGLPENVSYNVAFAPNTNCSQEFLGSGNFITDARGRFSGSFIFPTVTGLTPVTSGNFELKPADSGSGFHSFATMQIAF